jgi:predicted unusual protein kinase regulating ubiquinone biosynthesis (AarF/ABC1/UbiB family)
MLKGEGGVRVPEFLPKLSTDRLLTMTRMAGWPLLEVANGADLNTRNAIAVNMFRAWYVPFYYFGVIHGDPHLGNYTVRPDNTINLLDFGCIRIFRPTFVEAVIDLYKALRDDDEELAVQAYETWGFKQPSRELIDVLNIWAGYVYAPLMADKVQLIQQDKGVAYGAQVAGKVHRQLKRIGGVIPPREFVLMDRAAIGLGSVFMHLQAEVNWHQMFHDLIGDFEIKKLARNQTRVLKVAGLWPAA